WPVLSPLGQLSSAKSPFSIPLIENVFSLLYIITKFQINGTHFWYGIKPSTRPFHAQHDKLNLLCTTEGIIHGITNNAGPTNRTPFAAAAGVSHHQPATAEIQ